MNAREHSTKVGKLDLELNKLSKFLFFCMILLSLLVVARAETRAVAVRVMASHSRARVATKNTKTFRSKKEMSWKTLMGL
jgi:hypothetical protein